MAGVLAGGSKTKPLTTKDTKGHKGKFENLDPELVEGKIAIGTKSSNHSSHIIEDDRDLTPKSGFGISEKSRG